MPSINATTTVGLAITDHFLCVRSVFAAGLEVLNLSANGRGPSIHVTEAMNVSTDDSDVSDAPDATTYLEDDLTLEDMDHYFPIVADTPDVTTYLLIPLTPPRDTQPSPPPPGPSRPLLPLASLAALHNSHHLHSLRLSALFARLDAAHVRTCEAYGNAAGQCTFLRVKFRGWGKAEVLDAIGGRGAGWCTLNEAVGRLDLGVGQEDSARCLRAPGPAFSAVQGRTAPSAQATAFGVTLVADNASNSLALGSKRDWLTAYISAISHSLRAFRPSFMFTTLTKPM
ncbi:hypothetical protein PLICRDRAFT_603698 [Plicaturopsis crispa FD-325 SS-3]|nr:hypothetical protein PLICRDRAFT_603698 [Plicaturopsis crispa FD-325 SS-3]